MQAAVRTIPVTLALAYVALMGSTFVMGCSSGDSQGAGGDPLSELVRCRTEE